MKKKPLIAAALISAMIISLAAGVHVNLAKAQLSGMLIVPDDYPTIQAAIDASADNGTIFVRNGTYTEDLSINKPVSLIGENKYSTVIQGIGNTICLIQHDNVNVTGFTFTRTMAVQWYHNDVHLLSVNYCSIFGNIITNAARGVWVYESSYNNIYNNTFVGDGIVFESENSQNVVGSNYNNVTNNNLTNNSLGFGIIFYNGNNNVVADNCITFSEAGVEDASTVFNGNLIYGNQIANNGVGIATGMLTNLEQSSGNQIFGNNITGNDRGLWLDSDNNVIINNDITGNNVSIYMEGSQNNTIDSNIIQGTFQAIASGTRNTYQWPIPLLTNPNRIYLNDIIGSVILSDQFIPYHEWDNGTVGNYWSDYQAKYPNASEVNSSGIWNTPYVIDENNTDHYPLINQVDISNPALNSLNISIVSPLNDSNFVSLPVNGSFPDVRFPLIYASNESPSWVGYSVDGGVNVTVSQNGTQVEVPAQDGPHTLTLYADDTFGNWATSQTVNYFIAANLGTAPPESPTPSPSAPEFPTWLIPSIFLVTVFAAVSLARKKKQTGRCP